MTTINIDDLTPEQIAEITATHMATVKAESEAAVTEGKERVEEITAGLSETIEDCAAVIVNNLPSLTTNGKPSKLVFEFVIDDTGVFNKGKAKVGGVGSPVAITGSTRKADGSYKRAVSLGDATEARHYDAALKGTQGRTRIDA